MCNSIVFLEGTTPVSSTTFTKENKVISLKEQSRNLQLAYCL